MIATLTSTAACSPPPNLFLKTRSHGTMHLSISWICSSTVVLDLEQTSSISWCSILRGSWPAWVQFYSLYYCVHDTGGGEHATLCSILTIYFIPPSYFICIILQFFVCWLSQHRDERSWARPASWRVCFVGTENIFLENVLLILKCLVVYL